MDIYLHLSWEVNIMTADQLIWNIAQLEYSLFVVNSYAAGIQQNDGRYITKYFPMSPFVIEQMLLRQGSMGCYQQGYKTNRIKWICFDFDCKEKEEPNVYALYEQCVVPFIHVLDEVGLHYLTEFSGRRGIHVWIIFNKLLTKELGFQIVCEMEQRCTALNGIRESEIWGLDRFPATDSSRNNIVGKQVKFPLSRHRSGARSYFFTGKFQKKEDTESEHFLQEQLAILEGYEPNDSEEIACRLGVSISRANAANFKYRKYRLVGKVEITIDQVVEILSETAVFNRIFRRMQQGLALPQDWTVLLGTLYLCDSNAQLVKGVFQRFPNYDEHKTCRNIEKLGDRYFPATFSCDQTLLKALSAFERIQDKNHLTLETVSEISRTQYREITAMMQLQKGALEEVGKRYFCDFDAQVYYRLVHNLLWSEIDKEKIGSYLKVFMNHQKLGFAEISLDEKFARKDANTLYVPKDGRESDSVLTSIYEIYLKTKSARETNDMYKYILELKEDGYYYGDNRIENIVFLCDNFECGMATIRMLKAYLNIGVTDEGVDEKRKIEQVRASRQKYYLKEANSFDGRDDLSTTQEHLKEVSLTGVIEKNACTIEIHGYYGTERGKEAIEDFLKKQYIKPAVVTYEKEITKHASQIIDEVKNIWPRSNPRDNVYTVVREFNMTKMNVFPKKMLKGPEKAICMFVIKDEIKKC